MSTKFQVVKSVKLDALQTGTSDGSSSDDSDISDDDGDEEDYSSDEEDEDVDVEDEAGLMKDQKDNEEEDDVKRENASADTTTSSSSLTFLCEALCDFTGTEPRDLPFHKGEKLTIIGVRKDGWWEAENQYGDKGFVPSSFLKVSEKIKKYLDSAQASPLHTDKDHLWEKLRSGVKQSHYTDTTLTAFGAFPVGFCKATLSHLLNDDKRYSTEAFLAAKLSDSGLSFKDLHWSSSSNSVKPILSNIQRIIHVVAFRHIYPPGSAFNVLNRYIRICLHDGAKVLSNVHTIQAKWDPKTPKIWAFIPKISASGSCLGEGQFFVRTNNSSPTIGVLFQLCLTYSKVSDNETGEMSCGWIFMRLLDDSGLPVPSRTRVLRVHTGVPFLNDKDNNVSSGVGQKSGPLKFMNRVKHPRLVVSVSTPTNKTMQQISFLPTTLIESMSSIPLLVLYRKILADKLLRDRISFESTELIQSPFLCNFLRIFSQCDLVDALRSSWAEKAKKLKQIKSEKHEENKKLAFQQHFTETVFLILQLYNFPQFDLSNPQNQKERRKRITHIMKLIQDRGPLSVALSSEFQFKPLSVSDLSVNIIGPFCHVIDGLS